MYRSFLLSSALLLAGTTLACNAVTASGTAIPDPALDAPLASAKGEQIAVLAGGCFWGVEAVFEHVKGVTSVVSGYSGGTKATANYETVSSGKTDHAESVMIKFDPAKVTYQQLLLIFFSVAHDPTQVDRQGPDEGHQYRSVIFYTSDDQKAQALAFIDAVNKSKALSTPV